MDNNQKMLERVRAIKWLLPAGFAMLALLSAASVVLVFLSGLTRLKPDWIFNIAVDIVGIAVCAVLFYGCMSGKDSTEETTYLFVALLFTNGVALFLDECAWLVQGVPELRIWNIIVNVLFYANGNVLLYQFWRYIRAALGLHTGRARIATAIIQFALIPAILACFANLVFPLYFSVDALGVYRRGSLYPLSYLYTLLCVAFLIIGLVRSNASRRQKNVVISFVTLPLLNAVLTFNTFGISTQYVATLISIVLIYSVLFSDRSKSLAATQSELALATRIQADMLPNVFPPFPGHKEFDLHASMTPAKEVGGDFYDFFLVDDDHLGMVIADVAGKGIPAALFMMVSKILVQNAAKVGYHPAEALEIVNEQICANNREDMFVTVWFGVLDLRSGELTAANAGHEYPVLKGPDGMFELYKDRHGFVIGGRKKIRYREYTLQLEPGSKLFLYTDGVPEATREDDTLFGVDRMVAALNEKADASPEEILANVRRSVDAFVKGAEQFDDLTMLCLEYRGMPAE